MVQYSKKIWFKTISLVLAAAFFAQDLGFAAFEIKPAEFALFQKALPSFEIPRSVALTEDVFKAKGPKTLILLQDAHTNESAQFNISKALNVVLAKEKVKYVFLEAGTGNDSLSFLRNKAPLAERKRAAHSYIKKGLLSGEEYLDLTSEHSFILWGVENKDLYWKALKAYQAIVKDRDAFQDYLKRVEGTVKTLKPRIFNPSLLSFDEKHASYLNGLISLTDYYEVLSNEARLREIPLKFYPHLSALKDLKNRERAIDFKKAGEEQARALSALSKEDLASLVELTQTKSQTPFKVGNGDRKEEKAFYTLLEDVIARSPKGDEAISEYPELAKYLAYLREARNTNPQALLKEEKLLEAQIYASLTRNADEEMLYQASKSLRYLQRLFDLTLTPEEFDAYRQDPQAFNIVRLTGFLNKKIMDLKNHYERAAFLEEGYDEYIRKAEEFYELTYARDREFVKNALTKMSAEKESTAVLITGGYHTPNLKSLLKAQNISYISITPQVFHETNTKRYEKLLLEQLGFESAKRSFEGAADKAKRLPIVETPYALALAGEFGARMAADQGSIRPLHVAHQITSGNNSKAESGKISLAGKSTPKPRPRDEKFTATKKRGARLAAWMTKWEILEDLRMSLPDEFMGEVRIDEKIIRVNYHSFDNVIGAALAGDRLYKLVASLIKPGLSEASFRLQSTSMEKPTSDDEIRSIAKTIALNLQREEIGLEDVDHYIDTAARGRTMSRSDKAISSVIVKAIHKSSLELILNPYVRRVAMKELMSMVRESLGARLAAGVLREALEQLETTLREADEDFVPEEGITKEAMLALTNHPVALDPESAPPAELWAFLRNVTSADGSIEPMHFNRDNGTDITNLAQALTRLLRALESDPRIEAEVRAFFFPEGELGSAENAVKGVYDQFIKRNILAIDPSIYETFSSRYAQGIKKAVADKWGEETGKTLRYLRSKEGEGLTAEHLAAIVRAHSGARLAESGSSHRFSHFRYDAEKLESELRDVRKKERGEIQTHALRISEQVLAKLPIQPDAPPQQKLKEYFGRVVKAVAELAKQSEIEINAGMLREYVHALIENSPEKDQLALAGMFDDIRSGKGMPLGITMGNVEALSVMDLEKSTLFIDAGVLKFIGEPRAVEIALANVIGHHFFGVLAKPARDLLTSRSHIDLDKKDATDTTAIFFQVARKYKVDTEKVLERLKAVFSRIHKMGEVPFTNIISFGAMKDALGLPDLLKDRYEPLSFIGKGGMGMVFLGVDKQTHQTVAIKVQKLDDIADPNADPKEQTEEIKRFEREIEVARSIESDLIVKVLDSGTFRKGNRNVHFFVMEYVPWFTLKELMKRKSFSQVEIAGIMALVYEGLQAAHDAGCIHRDIKPDNIMIDLEDRRLKIADFGLAKSVASDATGLTVSGTFMGTPQYMSPEQARGETKDLDKRSDIYSAGVIFYEILTGRLPLAHGVKDTFAVLRAVGDLKVQAPLPRSINPAVDEGLQAIAMKAIEKNPKKRYQDASEIIADLHGWLAENEERRSDEIAQSQIRVRIRKDLKWRRLPKAYVIKKSNKAWWAAGILLGGTAALLLVIWAFSGNRDDVQPPVKATPDRSAQPLPKKPVVAEDLVAHYAFDEIRPDGSVMDSSGRTVGKNQGGVIVPGRMGNALYFNGVDAHVVVADHPSLDIRSDITLTAWVKFDKNYDFPKRDTIITARGEQYELGIQGRGAFFSKRYQHINDDGNKVTTDRWHFVAARQSAGFVTVFVDGVVTKHQSSSGGLSPGEDLKLYIGRGPQGLFKGAIDDVRVYRRGLPDEEIKQIFEGDGQVVPQPPPPTKKPVGWENLVAHYTFDNIEPDGTVKDATGKTVGKNFGATLVPGKIGNALRFNGVDTYVSLGSPGILDIRGDITLSAWVKFDSLDVRRNAPIIGKDENQYRLHVIGDTALFTTYADKQWSIVRGEAKSLQGSWYHVAARKSGNKATVWIDGILKGEMTIGTTLSSRAVFDGVEIGRTYMKEFFKGVMDDVRIYNRALTDEEIKAIFKGDGARLASRGGETPRIKRRGGLELPLSSGRSTISSAKVKALEPLTEEGRLRVTRSRNAQALGVPTSGARLAEQKKTLSLAKKVDFTVTFDGKDLTFHYEGLDLPQIVPLGSVRDTLTIGRAEKNTIRVDNPYVSGVHLRLKIDHGTGRITWKNVSGNGVWDQGKRVEEGTLMEIPELAQATRTAADAAPSPVEEDIRQFKEATQRVRQADRSMIDLGEDPLVKLNEAYDQTMVAAAQFDEVAQRTKHKQLREDIAANLKLLEARLIQLDQAIQSSAAELDAFHWEGEQRGRSTGGRINRLKARKQSEHAIATVAVFAHDDEENFWLRRKGDRLDLSHPGTLTATLLGAVRADEDPLEAVERLVKEQFGPDFPFKGEDANRILPSNAYGSFDQRTYTKAYEFTGLAKEEWDRLLRFKRDAEKKEAQREKDPTKRVMFYIHHPYRRVVLSALEGAHKALEEYRQGLSEMGIPESDVRHEKTVRASYTVRLNARHLNILQAVQGAERTGDTSVAQAAVIDFVPVDGKEILQAFSSERKRGSGADMGRYSFDVFVPTFSDSVLREQLFRSVVRPGEQVRSSVERELTAAQNSVNFLRRIIETGDKLFLLFSVFFEKFRSEGLDHDSLRIHNAFLTLAGSEAARSELGQTIAGALAFSSSRRLDFLRDHFSQGRIGAEFQELLSKIAYCPQEISIHLRLLYDFVSGLAGEKEETFLKEKSARARILSHVHEKHIRIPDAGLEQIAKDIANQKIDIFARGGMTTLYRVPPYVVATPRDLDEKINAIEKKRGLNEMANLLYQLAFYMGQVEIPRRLNPIGERTGLPFLIQAIADADYERLTSSLTKIIQHLSQKDEAGAWKVYDEELRGLLLKTRLVRVEQHWPFNGTTLNLAIIDQKKAGGWSVRQRLKIMLQLAREIVFLFENGVLHRDIKPSNVVVTLGEPEVKLTDFSNSVPPRPFGISAVLINYVEKIIGRKTATQWYFPKNAWDNYIGFWMSDDWRRDIIGYWLTVLNLVNVDPFVKEKDADGKEIIVDIKTLEDVVEDITANNLIPEDIRAFLVHEGHGVKLDFNDFNSAFEKRQVRPRSAREALDAREEQRLLALAQMEQVVKNLESLLDKYSQDEMVTMPTVVDEVVMLAPTLPITLDVEHESKEDLGVAEFSPALEEVIELLEEQATQQPPTRAPVSDNDPLASPAESLDADPGQDPGSAEAGPDAASPGQGARLAEIAAAVGELKRLLAEEHSFGNLSDSVDAVRKITQTFPDKFEFGSVPYDQWRALRSAVVALDDQMDQNSFNATSGDARLALATALSPLRRFLDAWYQQVPLRVDRPPLQMEWVEAREGLDLLREYLTEADETELLALPNFSVLRDPAVIGIRKNDNTFFIQPMPEGRKDVWTRLVVNPEDVFLINEKGQIIYFPNAHSDRRAKDFLKKTPLFSADEARIRALIARLGDEKLGPAAGLALVSVFGAKAVPYLLPLAAAGSPLRDKAVLILAMIANRHPEIAKLLAEKERRGEDPPSGARLAKMAEEQSAALRQLVLSLNDFYRSPSSSEAEDDARKQSLLVVSDALLRDPVASLLESVQPDEGGKKTDANQIGAHLRAINRILERFDTKPFVEFRRGLKNEGPFFLRNLPEDAGSGARLARFEFNGVRGELHSIQTDFSFIEREDPFIDALRGKLDRARKNADEIWDARGQKEKNLFSVNGQDYLVHWIQKDEYLTPDLRAKLELVIYLLWKENDVEQKIPVFGGRVEGLYVRSVALRADGARLAASAQPAEFSARLRTPRLMRVPTDTEVKSALNTIDLQGFLAGVAHAYPARVLDGKRIALADADEATILKLSVVNGQMVARSEDGLTVVLDKALLNQRRASPEALRESLTIADVRRMVEAVNAQVALALAELTLSHERPVILEINFDFIDNDSFEFYLDYLLAELKDARRELYGRNVFIRPAASKPGRVDLAKAKAPSLFTDDAALGDLKDAARVKIFPSTAGLTKGVINVPVAALAEGDVPAFRALIQLSIYSGRIDVNNIPDPFAGAYSTLAGARLSAAAISSILTAYADAETVTKGTLKAVMRVSYDLAIKAMDLMKRMIERSA